jgi:hypothetical protein
MHRYGTEWRSGHKGRRDMKKVMVVACVVVMTVAAHTYAAPAVDRYIQAIANLGSPKARMPAAPKGYGAVRDEQTGDFHVLVPKEYCGTNAPDTLVSLGRTRYGSQIIGHCQEF